MSGKGNQGNKKAQSSGGNHRSRGTTAQAEEPPAPTIVTGWQYHQYQRDGRYAYIGKDEDTGEPEFIDYGPASARR